MLTRKDKQFLRQYLFDAMGAQDSAEIDEHFDGRIPEETWQYLRDRERAVARALNLDF